MKGPGRWGLFSVEGFVAGLEHKVLESPSIPSFLGRESRNMLPLKVSYVVQILKKSVRIFLPRGMCFVLSHDERVFHGRRSKLFVAVRFDKRTQTRVDLVWVHDPIYLIESKALVLLYPLV